MNAPAILADQEAAPVASRLVERIAVLRRRLPSMLFVFGGAVVAALLFAFLWPATYRSSGTVLIEQQEVPEEFVRAAVTGFADQRVRVISQRVMTTGNLLDIIRKYDLYPERRIREPREKLLERMRGDIGLEMISADVMDPRQGRPTKATIAFTVSYSSRSPLVAAKVASELTTLFLNENLESRRQLAQDTAGFLGAEAERVGREVADLDRRIAEFKTTHADALPELSSINIQLMTRADDEMRGVDARLNALDQQIVYLDAQLAQIQPTSLAYADGGQRVLSVSDRLRVLRTQLASASALYGEEYPDVVRLQREVSGLEKEAGVQDSGNELVRQLTDAKAQLAQAGNRYSAEHPDVQRLERVVAAIETAMRDSHQTASSLQEVETPDNPAYIQIKAQREAAINERAALHGQLARLRGRIADFENRMANAPSVEREYSALLRDLQGAQLKYQEVRQKQMEAQVAANLEGEQKGERFTLIDPPLVPQQPASPNRPLILGFGLLLALAAAAGTAALREATDDRVCGPRDLAALVTVGPLAVIPWVDTEADLARRSKRHRLVLAAVTGAVAVFLLVVHVAVRPLDVIGLALFRQLGL